MYASECWAAKVTDETRMHVTEMRVLRWICDVTKVDQIRNEYVRGSLKVAPIAEKLRANHLRWYGHVMRRDDSHVTRRVLSMNVEGCKRRGRPRKRWMDCVRDDMNIYVLVTVFGHGECFSSSVGVRVANVANLVIKGP
jgi:hypothetical protein